MDAGPDDDTIVNWMVATLPEAMIMRLAAIADHNNDVRAAAAHLGCETATLNRTLRRYERRMSEFQREWRNSRSILDPLV